MKYQLIACDVDGTLLNSQRKLTRENIEAIKRAEKNGIRFVICTGRPLSGIKSLQEALGQKNGSAIIYNGATVIADGKEIYTLSIAPDTAKTIVREGEKRNTTLTVWQNNVLYAKTPCAKIDFYKKLARTEPVYKDDLTEICNNPVTKIVWYDDPSTAGRYVREMNEIVTGRASCCLSRIDFLEFVNCNCSKGTGLKVLADYYGIDMANTIAIGDNFNDLPMLSAAGLSVAMGNSEDEVKRQCDIVTDSCDDSGVAQIINKLLS